MGQEFPQKSFQLRSQFRGDFAIIHVLSSLVGVRTSHYSEDHSGGRHLFASPSGSGMAKVALGAGHLASREKIGEPPTRTSPLPAHGGKRIICAVSATRKTEARESRALSRNCNRIRIRADQWGRVVLRRMRRRLEAGSQETLHAVCMNLRMKGKVRK